MKHTLIALVLVAGLTATGVTAGGLSEPEVEPEVIIADTTESSGDVDSLILSLWAILFISAAAGAL